jgi:glycosyltransferase involved in cell wall biosynthesis
LKILFSSNIIWSVYNFRFNLLKSLQADGHEIFVVASPDEYADKLTSEGFYVEELQINNNRINPLEDFFLIFKYYRVYKKIGPAIICHNAIKPNIYGTIAAGILNIPVVNNISGLGTLFIKTNFISRIAKFLYKISQKKATRIFFQNNDDFELFVRSNLVDRYKCSVIPGSGVDTGKFIPSKSINTTKKKFEFMFVGRLLFDKGIGEYFEASKIIKQKYENVICSVLGPFYKDNSSSVSLSQLNYWIDNGIVNYLGSSDNVELVMARADCIVLPSYREGMSKVLLEASSMGIPIITTDVPGCRDVVINNVTGLICRLKDSSDLAVKMELMVKIEKKTRNEMGMKGRERIIEKFDEQIIIDHYKSALYSIIKLKRY